MADFEFPLAYGMEFEEWAALVKEKLSQYNIAIPVNKDSWESWAMTVCDVMELSKNSIPLPYGFNSWDEWADRLSFIHKN